MSDQGGSNEAGWQPDPHGRHEYRYWDGTAWTDQVSDGGVVSTDPPGDATSVTPAATPPVADPTTTGMPVAGPPSTEAPPYVPPSEDKPKGKLPVGLLALVGLAVAAIVAALVIFLGGGDDGGGGSGTGDFAGSVSEDEPFSVRTFDLEAGEAVRVIVEPEGDLDVALTLAIDPNLAESQIFGGSDLSDAFAFTYDELFSDAVPSDLSGDLSQSLDEGFSDFQNELSDRLPTLAEAGFPISTQNQNGAGDPEGGIFMAPLAGQYAVIVSGIGSEGDFEGKIETTGPSDEFEEQDASDDIDLAAYYAGIGPLRDFLCDEDFWGGPATDVTADAEAVCDDSAFDDLLSGDFSSDISDFSDFSDDFSDLSDFSDFTDDFSDFSDFSDDFSDFTDDPTGDLIDEDIGPIEVGDSIDGFIDTGTRDLYEFEGTGDLVSISVIGSYEQGGLDPVVTVLDSSGTEVGTDDDGNPEGIRNSLLEVTLDAGETYTIAVSGYTTSSGDYTVSVS